MKGYVDMRKLGGNKKTITATPRQLESLIRLSEAHARMRYLFCLDVCTFLHVGLLLQWLVGSFCDDCARFSKVVERVDVAEALRLIRSALQQAAVDPRTGTIDMDLITT